MTHTRLDIRRQAFHINDMPVYSELPGSDKEVHGLLMNARFIQGIFDDQGQGERYARFGRDSWDADANTDALIAALAQWYAHGLRAFTVGFQGGGPCFTIDRESIRNNPFGEKGDRLDPAYARRMDRLIRAADSLGMVVIVSYLYGSQALRLEDESAVRGAVTQASRFLKDGAYTNVIIEVANEQNVGPFQKHPIIFEPKGMARLIALARKESGGLPTGCSAYGGAAFREIIDAGDIHIIHGNSCTRQGYYNLIAKVREWSPEKPVLCNEDSPAIGQLLVARHTRSSWGYYNNVTKQEPPSDWSILPGEDRFFALRMAEMLGIPTEKPSFEEQFHLHGFEPKMVWEGMRWVRLSSLYPESIDFVEFYRDGNREYIAYDEPFAMNYTSNWSYDGVRKSKPGPESWKARVHLRDGRILEKDAIWS